jgi:tetratricopeptide (TPR) repeat protein
MATFSFLGEPRNQSISRVGPREIELRVAPGAPDGVDPPTAEDTRPAAYIDSDAPEIRRALQLLRSGGRSGSLPEIRRANATPVIARAALIQNPTAFWKDPVSVANIVSRFVYAILPDKRPTFSMADAVTTLAQGTGDCTEHSVLFAALMRAHGVPTRLVAGLYLSPGGFWVYHMWATYWDGSAWRQIDPITDSAPGALYVAIGRGATRFTDVRPDVAAFLDRAFTGVSFDLIAASSDGESLKLSYPRTPGGSDHDAATFNAAVLSVRGDPAAALEKLDGSISADTATVTARLFRAELLVELGRFGEALDAVGALRKNTSLPANTAALDALELRAATSVGDEAAASAVLARMARSLGDTAPAYLVHRARFLFATGEEGAAIELLVNAIASSPGDVGLKSCFAELAARATEAPSQEVMSSAEQQGAEALHLTRHADAGLYASMARLAGRLGRPGQALAYADAGLLLAPLDRELAALRETIARCGAAKP